MPIEFRCTQCRRLLRTQADAGGKQARCPECGTIVDVPFSSAPEEVRGAPPAETGAFPTAAAGASPFGAGVPPPSDATSPFGPDEPLSAGAPGSENPYESPRGVGADGLGPAYATDSGLHAYASSRAAGPAIALIILAASNLLYHLADLVLGAIGMAFPAILKGPGMGGFPGPPGLVLSLALKPIVVVPSLVILIGALKMRGLRSYAWAMTASILAVIPFPCVTSPCCCLGLPFGIWALVVLCDAQVQAAFRSPSYP